ncbi:UDP-N-acetylglucosamine--peptide N-acetylglucosaminyltransferase GtfA subunit [subsurface metagenome]
MKIAVIFEPSNSIGSSNEALNIVRFKPDVFVPIASQPIGGKPGLVEVPTRFGKPMNYPVASLMDGLEQLDPDGILICTVGADVFGSLPKMIERWPVAWRFNVNPLEFTFDPGMIDNIPQLLGTLSLVDAVVPCSPFVEENVKQLAAENTITIPTCIDTKECKLANPTKDLVISLTRIAPIKNILFSILAMGKVVNEMPTAEYEIYGEGVMAGHVANWIRQMRTERISYNGFKPANMVLPNAKLFLQTSISENFSLSMLEAMASGIPVVASDIPGHAMGNVYFDSIKQIADEVKLLLTDDDLREEWREMGLEKVKEFDVREVVPQWEGLFKKLMRLKEFKKNDAS